MAEVPASRERRRRRGAGPRLAAVLLVSAVLAGAVAPAAAARWGWLGVRIRDLTEREMEDITLKQGLREGYGVVIADVLPDTPAASSALKKDDVIVAIDGRPVVESRELQRIVGSAPAGWELTLIVLRPEGRRTVRVRVGPMPPDVVAERVAAGLQTMGVTTGAVVSWQLPTRLDTVVLSIALARLGAVQNPIIHLYREREVGFALRQTGAQLFVIPGAWRDTDFRGMAERALDGIGWRPAL